MKYKMLLPKRDILVVCFCVAFLGLTLSAMGSRGRHRAKMIICQMNQKQMATGTLMFANDNDGRLFQYKLNGLWITPLAEYTGKDEVRYCPASELIEKSSSSSYSWGASAKNWMWNIGTEEPEYGSYTFNYWFYSQTSYQGSGFFKNLANVQHPELAPLFADGLHVDGGAQETDTCPADFDLNGNPNYGGGMSRVLINRHFGENNISFADGHVEAIELKELWSLTWNDGWNINPNDMTRTDGSPIYPE